VAQTLPTVPIQHKDAPALAVLGKMLRSLYLHREIREKGGAYGGFSLYNPENGLFSLASYRDPHIVRTLNVFSGVLDFMRSGLITTEDVKEAILQVCSDIDKPDPPGPAARKAFSRQILGLTDETRLAFKQQLLKVVPQQVETVAETYFSKDRSGSGVAVIAGEQHLDDANELLAGQPLTRHSI
jgi:Zn-dependent M16 (insulinase) family peptidase